jgi:predicted GTPase
MSKFSKAKDNQILKNKYLTNSDIKVIDELKSAIKEDNIVATCMGLYNHGKSSLLNALIKDLEGKTFKTADTRETTTNKTVKYKNLTFVDTPGLNAQKNDDKRVMDAVKKSDINIFVHNVNTGEFVAAEVEFFHNIKKHWKNPKEFIERTIFVLSRIDEANSNEDVKNTAKKMKYQIKEIFETNAYAVAISSKDYVDGMIEKEDELIEISNIPILEEKITQLQDKLIEPIRKTKKDRLARYYDNLIKKLSSKLENDKLEIGKLQNEQKRIDIALKKDINKIETTLKSKYKVLSDIKYDDALSSGGM